MYSLKMYDVDPELSEFNKMPVVEMETEEENVIEENVETVYESDDDTAPIIDLIGAMLSDDDDD